MKFQVEKKLDLSYIGPEWGGAFLSFSAATFKDTTEISKLNKDDEANGDKVLQFLRSHFISGMAWDGTKLTEVTNNDIEDLPMEIVQKALETTIGDVSPKS